MNKLIHKKMLKETMENYMKDVSCNRFLLLLIAIQDVPRVVKQMPSVSSDCVKFFSLVWLQLVDCRIEEAQIYQESISCK